MFLEDKEGFGGVEELFIVCFAIKSIADLRKLATDEVNALMEGLSTGDVSGNVGMEKI